MSQDRQLISFAHAATPLFVGVDMAEDCLTVAVVDDRGRPLSWLNVATDADNRPELVLSRAGKAVMEAIRKASVQPDAIARVGLSLPGTVDSVSGKLIDSAGLPDSWQGLPICERFGAVCNLPVTFSHRDVAAAFGEQWVGAGSDFPSLVLLTLRRRIGCGVLFGDASIDGRSSYGKDAAHMIVQYGDDAPLCTCGQRGHLQAYVGAEAVVGRARQALESGRASVLSDQPILTTELLVKGAEDGDPLCLEVAAETARLVAVGIINIMNTLDPDGILLSGEMTFGGQDAPLGRQFLQWVKEEVARRAFAALVEHTKIEFAALGSDAACFGAAGIARAEHRRG
jgi:glucokinase